MAEVGWEMKTTYNTALVDYMYKRWQYIIQWYISHSMCYRPYKMHTITCVQLVDTADGNALGEVNK